MQMQRTAGDHPLRKETSKDLETVVTLPCLFDDAEPPAFNTSQPKAAVLVSLWNFESFGRSPLLPSVGLGGDPKSFLKENLGSAHAFSWQVSRGGR